MRFSSKEQFPYERYDTLAEPMTVYYPTGEDELARHVFKTLERAGKLLAQVLHLPMPDLEILLVTKDDWELAPRGEFDDTDTLQPYWTEETQPPTLVVPLEITPVIGELTPEKFSYLLYRELTLAFLEEDERPWVQQSPLWAEEWPLTFAAIWLAHRLDGVQGIVSKDLLPQFPDLFEPEADGKTPVTIRGFDWYEDTSSNEYLQFALLLEQFACDLLERNVLDLLPRYLAHYRVEREALLSDEATEILADALGLGGAQWLEDLVYF